MNTVTDRRQVQKAIDFGLDPDVRLPEEVLSLQGWSSAPVRHFLQKLCSADDVRYLEVGVWKGSTHIAALFDNEVKESMAIDDFSESWGAYTSSHDFGHVDNADDAIRESELEDFRSNCLSILGEVPPLINAEFLKAAKQLPLDTYNAYFYDGAHSATAQEQALTHFIGSLADVFVFVVDDWNYKAVSIGTHSGIKKCGLKIEEFWELEADVIGDEDKWWNGLGVFILSKPKTKPAAPKSRKILK